MKRGKLSASTANCASASLMIQMPKKLIWLDVDIVCHTRLVKLVHVRIANLKCLQFLFAFIISVMHTCRYMYT